jgi:hypothetical protein
MTGKSSSLTDLELELLDELQDQALHWLDQGHTEYVVNTNEHSRIHDVVWRELVRRVKALGWDANMLGPLVTIKHR